MNSAGTRPIAASEIAALTGGRLVGPGAVTVAGIAPLERAGPGDLSFLAAARYLPYFQRTSASVVLVKPEFADAEGGPATRVVVPAPHEALLVVLPVLYPQAVWEPGVHPTAVVGRGATWDEPVEIGPHAVLGAAVRLGKNVRIGAGYVLGEGGEAHRKIPHVGRCLISDDVEVGANTCIDRGSVDDTVIGAGTKIDNLVHIAHNVRIGARCLIMAEAGIAGSVQVGDEAVVAGQAGIRDHVTIGRGARLLVQAGIIADIPAGATVSGYPARSHREYLKAQAALYRLMTIVDELEDLVQAKHGADR